MIAVICPGCHRRLSIKDAYAGKSGICPHCKERIKVPAAAAGEITNPSPSDLEATAGGSRPPASPDDVTLPPPVGHSPSQPTVSSQELNFLAPAQGPGELGRLGSYRVLRVLGAGGMGMVLLAEDPMLKRAVALKVMRPELAAGGDARERFLREAQATAAIEHPNIIHVYQVAEDRGVPFLAMPFLKGEAMDVRLKRERRIPAREVVALGKQIAEGLAAAHKNGLIHRDIKPANIWLESHDAESGAGATCWVKILDFGLARALTGTEVNLTRTGAILGTPAYMAPEQARGEKVDGRCDLFSLGAVLYRMLTGEMPFKGNDTMSILMALATEDPRPLRELNADVPPALAAVVMQLLSKDPNKRPASARAVADALALLGEGRADGLRPASAPAAETGRGARSRPRWLLPVAGALLIGLIVVGMIFVVGSAIRKAIHERTASSVTDPEGTITNTVGMKLIPIEAGSFWMGSPNTEKERNSDEREHEVYITRPYYAGMYKVTVGQFAAFVKETGHVTDAEKGEKGSRRRYPDGKWRVDPGANWRNPGFEQTDDHPVVCVSFQDAAAFCAWLTAKEGKQYDLPSEAYWEYLCRAGSRKAFFFSDDDRELDSFAWFVDNSAGGTHPVGQKKPNPWGLYDVHGNAWEWCVDFYDKDYYLNSPKEDPEKSSNDGNHVIRGGGWNELAKGCRAANRQANPASAWSASDIGFRVIVRPEALIGNGIGMKLKRIRPARFLMGSPPKETSRGKNEQQHEVILNRPFWIGIHEVTVGQFAAFVKETNHKTEAETNGKGSQRFLNVKDWQLDLNTTWRTPGFEQSDDHPVVCVSWNDAKAFCDWLSKKEGKPYALPTEAQWEYCCRAGTTSRFFFGNNLKDMDRFGWYRENAANRTHPVAQKKPNPWGLYDMLGNAAEWCADRYIAEYENGTNVEPKGPLTGKGHVHRGGSWHSMGSAARSASRGLSTLSTQAIGFRVVLLAERELTNSIGMKLTLLPTGSFKMGSPPGEVRAGADEYVHDVAVTRPFYLGAYKVTVKQFKAFVDATGYQTEAERTGQGAVRLFPNGESKLDPRSTWRNPGFAQTDDHPVVCVSWNDATAFCDWLTQKEGRRYKLPTEAQWEYACRTASATRYYFGDDVTLLKDYAWYAANSGNRTRPVGLKTPNLWGLYDMYGNAAEIVMDRYGANYYKKSPKEDPPGPIDGNYIVLRGGGWNHSPEECRSAKRFRDAQPSSRSDHCGFRVLLVE